MIQQQHLSGGSQKQLGALQRIQERAAEMAQ